MTYDKYMQIMRNQPGLVGCWMFHKNNGNHLHDYSRHGNHGTIDGATFRGNYGAGALDFDGNDDRVNCGGDSSLIITGPLSVDAWVNTDDISVVQGIIGTRGSTQKTYHCYLLTIIHEAMRFSRGDNTSSDTISSTTLSTGKWIFVAAVDDGSYLRIFINGTEDATPVSKTITPTSAFDNLTIGSFRATSVTFGGLIDEVRIFNRALSADEIKRNYDLGKQFHID